MLLNGVEGERFYFVHSYAAFTAAPADLTQFDIDLGDFYHTYMELKAKTKDRTGFLSTLKDRLLMRMREQD